MKIQGPGRSGGTKGVSKAGSGKKTGDASFDALIGEDEGSSVDAAQLASGSSSIASIGALLSMQDVGTATDESKRKAKHRAGVILDQMDKVRMALLDGSLSRQVLEDLSRMVKSQREKVSDPRLTEILDEIDMRAQIEIAKYDRE